MHSNNELSKLIQLSNVKFFPPSCNNLNNNLSSLNQDELKDMAICKSIAKILYTTNYIFIDKVRYYYNDSR